MGSIEEITIIVKNWRLIFTSKNFRFFKYNTDNITNSIKIEATSMYAIFNSNKKSQIIFI